MSRHRASFIFTYGTLMSTAACDVGRAERAAMASGAVRIGPGSIRGRLYDAGLYPAAVLDRWTLRRIHGEIWQLPPDPTRLLELLDLYEGCGTGCAEPYPYERVRVSVRGATLNRIEAWMYVWRRPTETLPEIHGGRWRVHADRSHFVDIIRRPPQPSPSTAAGALARHRANP